jgi:hypothetical protein
VGLAPPMGGEERDSKRVHLPGAQRIARLARDPERLGPK